MANVDEKEEKEEVAKCAVITGANRGLGLEFARQLLQRPGPISAHGVRSLASLNWLHDSVIQDSE